MNKLLSFALAFMLILSCQAAKKERLELNLTKGDVYHHKMNTESTVIQSMYGSEMEVKTHMIFHTAYKVIDIKDSIYEMEVTYKSIYMKMSLPMGGGDMEINSEKAIGEDVDEMASLFKAILNKPFNMKMSRKGRIIEISNLDEILNSEMGNMPENQYGQMKGQLGQMLGEESLKKNFEMLTAIFPEKEVAKGDKWEKEVKQESEGMPMDLKTTYELKKIGKNFYEIEGNSTIKMNMENEISMGEEGDALMIISMEGNMLSNIHIDKSTGWVNKATMNQEISGKIDINSMMEIPMTMKNKIEITKE